MPQVVHGYKCSSQTNLQRVPARSPHILTIAHWLRMPDDDLYFALWLWSKKKDKEKNWKSSDAAGLFLEPSKCCDSSNILLIKKHWPSTDHRQAQIYIIPDHIHKATPGSHSECDHWRVQFDDFTNLLRCLFDMAIADCMATWPLDSRMPVIPCYIPCHTWEKEAKMMIISPKPTGLRRVSTHFTCASHHHNGVLAHL